VRGPARGPRRASASVSRAVWTDRSSGPGLAELLRESRHGEAQTVRTSANSCSEKTGSFEGTYAPHRFRGQADLLRGPRLGPRRSREPRRGGIDRGRGRGAIPDRARAVPALGRSTGRGFHRRPAVRRFAGPPGGMPCDASRPPSRGRATPIFDWARGERSTEGDVASTPPRSGRCLEATRVRLCTGRWTRSLRRDAHARSSGGDRPLAPGTIDRELARRPDPPRPLGRRPGGELRRRMGCMTGRVPPGTLAATTPLGPWRSSVTRRTRRAPRFGMRFLRGRSPRRPGRCDVGPLGGCGRQGGGRVAGRLLEFDAPPTQRRRFRASLRRPRRGPSAGGASRPARPAFGPRFGVRGAVPAAAGTEQAHRGSPILRRAHRTGGEPESSSRASRRWGRARSTRSDRG